MTKTWAPLLLAATLAVASPAAADTITVTFGPYQTGTGGEFTLTPDWALDLSDYSFAHGTRTIDSFQSFCIEIGESISDGGVYDAALSLNATENNDPISRGTALLYAAFATGMLGDYDYDDVGVGRNLSAQRLQNAIWMLEDELTWNAGNYFINQLLLSVALSDEAYWKANAAPGSGVQAVNLTKGRLPRQDQLYYNDPTTTFNIPDGGATLTLMGFALLGIAVLSRRFGLGSAR